MLKSKYLFVCLSVITSLCPVVVQAATLTKIEQGSGVTLSFSNNVLSANGLLNYQVTTDNDSIILNRSAQITFFVPISDLGAVIPLSNEQVVIGPNQNITQSFRFPPFTMRLDPTIPGSIGNYRYEAVLSVTPTQAANSTVIPPGISVSGEINFSLSPTPPPIAQVPEPLTILGSGMALGCGVLMERRYSRKRKKTKQIG